jgi:hypothetical protein
MNTTFRLVVAAAFLLSFPAAAATNAIHCYVQLIRATDEATSPSPGATQIGPKLSKKFHEVFRGKTYWEVKREEVIVAPGQPARVALNEHREVEIEVTADKRIITTYYKGKLVDRTTAARGDGLTMIGDSRGKNTCCFIVVRRDKPTP